MYYLWDFLFDFVTFYFGNCSYVVIRYTAVLFRFIVW